MHIFKWDMICTYIVMIFKIIKMLTIIYGPCRKGISIGIVLNTMYRYICCCRRLMWNTNSYGVGQMWIYAEKRNVICILNMQFYSPVRKFVYWICTKTHTHVMKYLAWNHLIFIRFKTHFHFKFSVDFYVSYACTAIKAKWNGKGERG